MAAGSATTNPLAANGFARYRGELILAGVTLLAAALIFFLVYHFWLRLPEAVDAPQGDAVSLIYTDAYWFHQLWMRWTGVDWVLTALATGTAISAVIKNAFSTKQAATAEPSFFDKVLVVLAVLTVLATTFDGKLHAGQLADKYRSGDIILQRAKIDYSASKKTETDKAELLNKWHQAQDYLASPIQAAQRQSETPATSAVPQGASAGEAAATPKK